MLKYLAKKSPFKTLMIIRFCPLPKWARTYMTPLLDYNFKDFMIAGIIAEFYFSLIAILIGM